MAARLGRSRPASAYRIHSRLGLVATNPAVMDVTLGSVTFDGTGTPTPPSGDIGCTLGNVTATFAATSDTGGSAVVTLGSVTGTFAGAVQPAGAIAVTLGAVSVGLVAETRPFGEQVIVVDPEKRGLRIGPDDTVPIYLTEVTNA